MKIKMTLAAALIAAGVMTASAQTRIQITGSTAFRGAVYNACSTAGGFFTNTPTVLVPSGSPSSSSGTIVYRGFATNGVEYILACSWSGSEAGIAATAGKNSLANPGLTTGPLAGSSIPGIPVKFPNNDGTAGSTASTPDLTFADTSQAVSLTRTPANPKLYDFGVVGMVPFVWIKGRNTAGASDSSWTNLVNVTHPQMLVALGSTVTAGFLNGNSTDTAPVYMVGRNAGSGTRANTLLDTYYGVTIAPNQVGFNSYYNASGSLTYIVWPNDASKTYPSIATCLGSVYANDGTATPAGGWSTNNWGDAVTLGGDGYDSGAGVANSLQCDLAGSGVITLGYAGISDAKAARDGAAASGSTPAAPGGAVWLSLDGVPYSDKAVVNGTYTFWGHEHLLGQATPSTAASTVAGLLKAGIYAKGQLGDGTGGPSTGIKWQAMQVDKPSGGDTGYPTTGAPTGTQYN